MRPNLIRAREHMGWSVAEAARQCGVSYRAYRYYETGERSPNLQDAARLADLFGVEMRELFVQDDSTAESTEKEQPVQSAVL